MIVASFGPVETADLDVSDTAFPEASWVPRTGRAWAAMASAGRVGSFVCNSLIEHSLIGQCVLVGAFLVCFRALHPTATEIEGPQDSDDDDFATGSDISTLTEQMGFWQVSQLPSAAISVATTESFVVEGGVAAGSQATSPRRSIGGLSV